MTKLGVISAIGAAFLLMGGAAFAQGANPYDKIGADNPAFEGSGKGNPESIRNVHNNDLRFGPGGGVVVPGNANQNANDNSVVSDHNNGDTMVRPRGRN